MQQMDEAFRDARTAKVNAKHKATLVTATITRTSIRVSAWFLRFGLRGFMV